MCTFWACKVRGWIHTRSKFYGYIAVNDENALSLSCSRYACVQSRHAINLYSSSSPNNVSYTRQYLQTHVLYYVRWPGTHAFTLKEQNHNDYAIVLVCCSPAKYVRCRCASSTAATSSGSGPPASARACRCCCRSCEVVILDPTLTLRAPPPPPDGLPLGLGLSTKVDDGGTCCDAYSDGPPP